MFVWADWHQGFTLSTKPEFPQQFPNLRPHLCVDDISDATREYNCIAWAASDTSAWWEPDPFFQYYWPDGVARVYTVEAYIAAFASIDFVVCEDGLPEAGMEKIVLYARNGQPTHAARLLRNGNWTSKLGDFEDIQHVDLHCLNGPLYGMPQICMKRKLA